MLLVVVSWECVSVCQCLHTHMLLMLNMSFLVYIYLFYLTIVYLTLWNRVSDWTWSSLILVDWLGIELQGSVSLGLPHSTPKTGIASNHWYSGLSSFLHSRPFDSFSSPQPESTGWQKYYTICKIGLIGVDFCHLVKKNKGVFKIDLK